MIDILKKIDSEPIKFLKMDSDERKKVAPYVVNMWRFGASNTDSILVTNESLNLYIFSVKSKTLQEKLMLSSGIAGTKYKWYPNSNKNKSCGNEILDIICDYANCSPDQANDYLKNLNKEDLNSLLEMYGMETKKVKK